MRLDSTQDEISYVGLRRRLCMLAATCFSTFDVCSEHVPAILASKEDLSVAVQCAVIVYDNTPESTSLSNDDALYLNRMLSRHRRLLYHLEPIFSQPLQSAGSRTPLLHSDAYNDALGRLRPGHRLGNSYWHVLPRPNCRWISCVTAEEQDAYYDLLTGKLMIGGKPLERLPREIVDHPTYSSVFGAVSRECCSSPGF
jgi:hypothetical protein